MLCAFFLACTGMGLSIDTVLEWDFHCTGMGLSIDDLSKAQLTLKTHFQIPSPLQTQTQQIIPHLLTQFLSSFSRVYPVSHEHSKDPSLFVQVCSHMAVPSRHSLISADTCTHTAGEQPLCMTCTSGGS